MTDDRASDTRIWTSLADSHRELQTKLQFSGAFLAACATVMDRHEASAINVDRSIAHRSPLGAGLHHYLFAKRTRDERYSAALRRDRPPLMRSFMILLGRNTNTRRGVIGTSSPVLGLRPIRCPF